MGKFYRIGEAIGYEGVSLTVTPQRKNLASCAGCYFNDTNRRKRGLSDFSCYLHGMECTASMRRDRKHIIFKEL